MFKKNLKIEQTQNIVINSWNLKICLDTITVHKVSLIIQGKIHEKYILNYKKVVFVRYKTVPQGSA